MSQNAHGKSSHPLRPYYQPQDDSAFIASAPSASSAPRVTKPRMSASANANARSDTSTVASNRYISDDLYGQDYSNNARGSSISDLASAALTTLALQYTSTCLAMPFEVGKLLLQVQWVPTDQVWRSHVNNVRSKARLNKRAQFKREKEERRKRREATRSAGAHNLVRSQEMMGEDQDQDVEEEESESDQDIDDADYRHELAPEAEEWQDEQQERSNRKREFGAEADELSDSDEAEAYFRDLSSQSTRPTSVSHKRTKKAPTDSSGYMIRRNLNDSNEGTKPEFVMPIVVKGGVLEMMKAVGRGKEGWLGLFKGTLTTFILDNSFNTIQPLFSSFFSLFTSSSSPHSTNLGNISLTYSPYPITSLTILLSSHLITGVLLSPLDLIRTRLISQSTLSPHRKYKGPYNALKQILKTEGGWRTIYLHPNLLIPTVLDYTFRPLFNLSIPLIIEYGLHVEPNLSPITYASIELILNSAGLLITLPIETVRRRLQLQLRASWGEVPDVKTPVHSSNPDQASSSSKSINNTNISPKSYVNSTGLGKQQVPTIVKPEIDYERRPLRTCVETRPEPYAGVVEAIYKILTEETSLSHKSSPPTTTSSSSDQTKSDTAETGKARDEERARRSRNESTDSSASYNFMSRSGIIAKTGNSSLGGLSSLYRGLTMGLSANLVVFMLTLVGGERAGASGGWAEI